ncbi:vanadium-dependent haloperoxidase [Catalinimonas niigatensis]|uniref:vanadium-dependent haloperoxidase n=1 Tax=Catalinimonas niigatensis TaxID=1397264 RepID=UPI0026655D40|nr:vanadium-dependent haloperoxidase [Catalinimonas niigatensis]WPP52669.1 phosphatase PAP2 family protein [Catalinimonas niigatensis]
MNPIIIIERRTQRKHHLLHSSAVSILVILCLSLPSCQAQEDANPINEEISNELIIDWNHLTYKLAYEHDQFYSFIGVRTLSMVHLAMHDALNAISPQFEQYAYQGKNSGANPIAAASQAAYEVLLNAYPERKDTIQTVFEMWMMKVSESKAKEEGVVLGKSTAQAIIEMREGDGHLEQGGYTPMTKPGDYQYTPGWDEWVLKPDFDFARPFAMDTVTQFRSSKPPTLMSEDYSASFQEVKAYGRKNSKVRTTDETNYAHWWAEFAEHGWNRIGRITARQRALPLLETARMFALINMDIYDIYLASLESKYYYDTWRPYTAIRNADVDENPETIADPNWEPEMQTPPWPEYPSAHASVAAGSAEILTHVYGTPDIAFEMESTSALTDAKRRSYANLDSAASDCADSRIMNGYHFRFATQEGSRQGREVARYICSNFLGHIN